MPEQLYNLMQRGSVPDARPWFCVKDWTVRHHPRIDLNRWPQSYSALTFSGQWRPIDILRAWAHDSDRPNVELPIARNQAWVLFKSAVAAADLLVSAVPDDALEREIESSRRITELEDDWDDCGSEGYTTDTWQRAVDYLHRMTAAARDARQTQLPVPAISPADSGTIDLYWANAAMCRLLINVPANPNAPIAYYGERDAQTTISGTVKRGTVRPELVTWLLDDDEPMAD